jgi:hypothetical protein
MEISIPSEKSIESAPKPLTIGTYSGVYLPREPHFVDFASELLREVRGETDGYLFQLKNDHEVFVSYVEKFPDKPHYLVTPVTFKTAHYGDFAWFNPSEFDRDQSLQEIFQHTEQLPPQSDLSELFPDGGASWGTAFNLSPFRIAIWLHHTQIIQMQDAPPQIEAYINISRAKMSSMARNTGGWVTPDLFVQALTASYVIPEHQQKDSPIALPDGILECQLSHSQILDIARTVGEKIFFPAVQKALAETCATGTTVYGTPISWWNFFTNASELKDIDD